MAYVSKHSADSEKNDMDSARLPDSANSLSLP